MKNVLIVSLILIIIAFSLPLIIAKPLNETPKQTATAAATAAPTPHVTPLSTPAVPAPADSVTVKLSRGGKVSELSLSDYLIGVVAAEMPASFSIEALKAQAVASRTYLIYNVRGGKHDGFDVCDDISCCAAYADSAALHDKWGLNFDTYYSKIKSAVESTDGLYLTWEGEAILAAFHASSFGSTESSENVWSSPKPYLKSVSTPETADKVTNLFTTLTVSEKDFKETVLKKYPDAVFDKDTSKWITQAVYDESGRVSSVNVGGVKLTGVQLRTLFSLRSAAFTCKADNGGIVFAVSGYGHGVGMSQYGANIMAKNGASYEEILLNYYTGVEFSKLSGSIIKGKS